ncbi:MAG TPA: HIT family protein [Candidatus Kapabacteria bacterium]|jgi:histidine triad (HIT) family protein
MSCIFCDIIAQREPASIVYENESVLAFMSIQPTRPGECLIIPKVHIDHFTDLPEELAAHLMVIGERIGKKTMEVFSPKRIGMLVHGFGVPHAHLILVPQHRTDDVTSARFARIENDTIVFDLKNIARVSRDALDRQAQKLRI